MQKLWVSHIQLELEIYTLPSLYYSQKMDLCGNKLIFPASIKQTDAKMHFLNLQQGGFQGRNTALPSIPKVENCFSDAFKLHFSLLKSVYFMLTILSELSIGSVIYIFVHMYVFYFSFCALNIQTFLYLLADFFI